MKVKVYKRVSLGSEMKYLNIKIWGSVSEVDQVQSAVLKEVGKLISATGHYIGSSVIIRGN